MSYQVLARKYRPSSFEALQGQEHVLQALVNALDQNRLHHAYLFTGTRGVGKTTIARILARCLNCEKGVSSTPCGECSTCVEISEGRNVDLIEIDAASRTGVDDMRDLLDNVQYMPTANRFKVYLIDEVHMLSKSSFNAMLKTLEEPPEHVKFLFATTDPKKLPVTVLSRCLQFNLKNLSPEQIVGYLKQILPLENVEFEEGALWQIGRAADGSMRDALSLADQAISFGRNRLTDENVKLMLGSLDQREVYALLDALLADDGKRLLDKLTSLAEFAPDYPGLLDELLSVLHRVAIAQAVPEGIDNSQGDRELVLAVAEATSREDIQLYYQIGLIGKRDLPLAPDPRGGFEMILLRMLAFTPVDGASKPETSGGRSGPISEMLSRIESGTGTTGPVNSGSPASSSPEDDWPSLLRQLDLSGVTLTLAANCTMKENTGEHCKLILDEHHASLWNKTHERRISEALTRVYGHAVTVSIETGQTGEQTPAEVERRAREARKAEAITAIENDKNIQALISSFNGTLDRDSITPMSPGEGS